MLRQDCVDPVMTHHSFFHALHILLLALFAQMGAQPVVAIRIASATRANLTYARHDGKSTKEEELEALVAAKDAEIAQLKKELAAANARIKQEGEDEEVEDEEIEDEEIEDEEVTAESLRTEQVTDNEGQRHEAVHAGKQSTKWGLESWVCHNPHRYCKALFNNKAKRHVVCPVYLVYIQLQCKAFGKLFKSINEGVAWTGPGARKVFRNIAMLGHEVASPFNRLENGKKGPSFDKMEKDGAKQLKSDNSPGYPLRQSDWLRVKKKKKATIVQMVKRGKIRPM
eukprot:gnl/TRDRNA2_/TRDRNA2_168549_c1_seq1.p1 gnl/TRDRNA2_/TRDRNA2_168549_c1~~gnl/TRDRNA2_/TRDRNA2_168549_c1_seq1.p1  ORF type:complete len:283 (+),score=51.11 gnl/TRDRNA2_/TRDRNA2_168549_c1_seq1:53-901(+)